MLVLHNQRIELSNVRKKNTKCGKSTVKCDIGTVQLSNVRKKNKGISKCDKRTVTYDVGTT